MTTLAITALFYNEARYLKEFIEFHQLVGVSRFYFLNDQSSDNYLQVLRPYRESGLVRLIEFPLIQGRTQADAYRHILPFIRRENDIDLLAVIDID